MNYTREQFALDLRRECVDAVVRSSEQSLQNPPGRKPAKRLVTLSKWYRSLDEEHQQTCRQLMEYIAEASLFSTLTVLDGASLIAEDLRDADLRLTLKKDGEELLLSSTEHSVDLGTDLHELMFPSPE